MTRTRAVLLLTTIFVAVFAVATTGLVLANNQWSCWHWDKDTISARSVASGYWGTIISSELSDWDAGTCVTLTGGSEITGDAGFYGNTGWLGIARLLQTGPGCTIVEADALMNQTYLDGSSYDETADRHVTCQEIGHDLGLDHRKGPRNQTCMNDQFVAWDFFNQHDADTVAEITGGSNCSGGGGDPCDNGGEKGRKKCNDGIDNDGDGCTDGADPDCA